MSKLCNFSVCISLDLRQEGAEKLIPGMSVVTYVDTSQCGSGG
ncbi:hypothetical protein [Bartonella henselae]